METLVRTIRMADTPACCHSPDAVESESTESAGVLSFFSAFVKLVKPFVRAQWVLGAPAGGQGSGAGECHSAIFTIIICHSSLL